MADQTDVSATVEIAPDPEELCICFHVSVRQVVKHLRHEQPVVASQCSNCYGAGTGCGWCIPFIEQLFEQHQAGVAEPQIGLTPQEYRARRRGYLRTVKMERMAPKSMAVEPNGGEPEPEELVDEILDE